LTIISGAGTFLQEPDLWQKCSPFSSLITERTRSAHKEAETCPGTSSKFIAINLRGVNLLQFVRWANFALLAFSGMLIM